MPARRSTTSRAKAAKPAVVAEAVAADPAPEPVEARCAFPLEMRNGRCPVAVFNSPRSPNEKIAFSPKKGAKPVCFDRGLLAVFTEAEAQVTRKSNPGNSTYIEANPRLGDEPLVCSSCYPKTRWYSQQAYEQHMTFAHVN